MQFLNHQNNASQARYRNQAMNPFMNQAQNPVNHYQPVPIYQNNHGDRQNHNSEYPSYRNANPQIR